ncbi:unnamed protein product [Choristocarpus tenellus]
MVPSVIAQGKYNEAAKLVTTSTKTTDEVGVGENHPLSAMMTQRHGVILHRMLG